MTRINDWRTALRVRHGYWFAPRLYGYGATPVTWQGWALTLGFAALIIAGGLMGLRRDVFFALLAPALAGYVWLVWRKTDGGWRWRWGPDHAGAE